MIDVVNLSKSYGTTRAVTELSFRVEPGQILGLLGPNGAGKTTTMRIITGYLAPTRGQVLINGTDITNDPSAKRRMGYLPEFAPLYQEMLVLDLLQFAAAVRQVPRGARRGRLQEMARVCGLAEVMHRPFRELSRGYKQRAGLAYALISDPDFLILDEPTSGLDPNQIVEIRAIIREIGRKRTVIFSTHILSEAESTCDRIIIINRGRVVADGTAADVKRSAATGVVIRATLLGTNPTEAATALTAIADVVRATKVAVGEGDPPQAVALLIECRRDVRSEIYQVVKNRDWIVLEMSSAARSLEQVFQQLTATAGAEG